MASSKMCVICGKTKKPSQCLKHKNELLNSDLTICKECANQTDFNVEREVIEMCQLTNLPFVKKLVVEVISENDKPTFGMYMRKLAPYKRFEVFDDSQFSEEENSDPSEFEVTEDIKQKWGDNYSLEKYAYFESALKGLMAIKAATTSLEVERYIQNVKLKDVLNEALQDGDFKAITQLRKAYNDDLKELGFDSVLNAKDDSGESLGQRIQKWETTKPVPDRDEFTDTSRIMKYVQKWFITPLRRNFGMAEEKEVASLYDTDTEK